MSKETRNQEGNTGRLPPAETGNASNPSPQQEGTPQGPAQLIDPKGEKYLREVANIEDLPDAQEEEGQEDTRN